MGEEVRVRFAPSPTGEPHIGNLRTALFNWLFASRQGGKFIVRVEDTDRDRYAEGALKAILEALEWLGIGWDEGPEVGGPYGPYFQSERLDLYQSIADELITKNHAYRCYCSKERLDEMRQEQQRRKQPPGYDRHCLKMSSEDEQELKGKGIVPVVRFKMPTSGETAVDDLIRGRVSWQNELQDDFVILKSDGFPTYHLASVIDDHHMKISHILRAEEWLPSTPRHLQLYKALQYDYPRFVHLPMILGPDKAKLSKRHGANSILEYRDAGFLPDAMVNFMALLGWSLDDKTDVMSRNTLMENFSLQRIGKAGAAFDEEKLEWMSGVYIRSLDEQDLADRMLPFLKRDLPSNAGKVDSSYLRRIIPLIKERIRTLGESSDLTEYFFLERIDYDAETLVQKGMDKATTSGALSRALDDITGLSTFDAASLEETLRQAASDLGLSGRQLFGALRVAVTGRTAAPPLFETMEVLGRHRCLERVESAVKKLGAMEQGSSTRAGNP